MSTSQIIEASITLGTHNYQEKPSRLLADETRLSQTVIKDAMQKGAVWLYRGKSRQRLRRASRTLKAGDRLVLNYNADLLRQQVPEPDLLHDAGAYSIWHKPAGLFCQGSRWGDFASINRWVEIHLNQMSDRAERNVFLVHRLDRATTGLILLCHSKSAARLFSELFANGQITKRYQAIVHGDFSPIPHRHEISNPVDGKAARSLVYCAQKTEAFSLVDVELLTGRKHQIRQHLSRLGYPVVGDTLYGRGHDKTYPDLQLQSVSLGFTCPLTRSVKEFSVAQDKRLQLRFVDDGN
ncbi:MAG: RluA family pseudouridine synthase [Granulosicoccus sp.]